MKTETTEVQIAKLPAWARELIADLRREREAAIKRLDAWTDTTTPSPFSVVEYDCTGEQAGPTRRVAYIQAHTIEVEWKGVLLTVSAHDFGNRGEGINLQWGDKDKSRVEMAMIPTSFQSCRLVTKEGLK